ncbi:hypothetical protein V6N13_103147 [Hibiscus sabdariffa]
MDRLNSWGLGDIKVKHIGGYQYLIEIRDIELFKMLEDLQWSYLKEVFIDVFPWSASFKPKVETMKNLASLRGNLEGMGENANQIQKCESLSLLIATDQEEFINEVVGVDLGSELFHVRVSELCPWILGTRLRDRPIMSTPSSESEARSSVEVESKNFRLW